MRFHLPKSLLTALLSCYSAIIPVLTVGTVTLTTFGYHAQASNTELKDGDTTTVPDIGSFAATETIDGTIDINGVIDGTLQNESHIFGDAGAIFNDNDQLNFSGDASTLTLGGPVTVGAITVDGTDATIQQNETDNFTFAAGAISVGTGTFKLDAGTTTLDGVTTYNASTGDITLSDNDAILSGTFESTGNLIFGTDVNTITIAAGSNITTSGESAISTDGYEIIAGLDRTGTTTSVGKGASLTETLGRLVYGKANVETTSTITGEGTYTVLGIKLSAENGICNLIIDTDATMVLSGDAMHWNNGSFMVSNYGKANVITIKGTLISNAGISNRDGTAIINIEDGGKLELRKGGAYSDKDDTQSAVINVEAGATLAFGNQVAYDVKIGATVSKSYAADRDYGTEGGAKLTINLGDGSTFASATSEGTYIVGDVTVYHTLNVVAGTTINFMANQADQTLIMTKGFNVTAGDGSAKFKANISAGAGSVELQNTNSLSSLTVKNGANAKISSVGNHVNTLTNVTVNSGGTLDLAGNILLKQSIVNDGTVSFDLTTLVFDLSDLVETGDNSYTLITGTGNKNLKDLGLTAKNFEESFTTGKELTVNNDGTISWTDLISNYSYAGGTLDLVLGSELVGGTFANDINLTFNTAAATVNINDVALTVNEMIVHGVEATFAGNGSIDAEIIRVTGGGTFILKNNILADNDRILAGSVTDKFVGDGNIAANSYLEKFIGEVTIKSGDFVTANHGTTFSSLTINAGASFTYGGAQNTTYGINLVGATSPDGAGASMTMIGGTHTGEINVSGNGNTINTSGTVNLASITGDGNLTINNTGAGYTSLIGHSTNTGILTLAKGKLSFGTDNFWDATLMFSEIKLMAGTQFAIHNGNTDMSATTFTFDNAEFLYYSKGKPLTNNEAHTTFGTFKVEKGGGKFRNVAACTFVINKMTGVGDFLFDSTSLTLTVKEIENYNGTISVGGAVNFTLGSITQDEGNSLILNGPAAKSKDFVMSGAGSAQLNSLNIAADGSITKNGEGSLTITNLAAGTGSKINANAGTITITNLGSSNMAASVAANAILNVGTGSLASLDSAGTVTSTGDLTVAGNVTGTGSIDATGSVILNGASNTVNTIKATGSITATGDIEAKSITATEGAVKVANLTLTGDAISVMDSLEITNSLTLSHVSQINVTNVLTVSSITINGSNLASADSPTTALITAGSIAGDSLTVTLTTDALANMNFDIDGQFTLIDLGTAYDGEFIFNIDGVATLDLASNTGIILGEEFQVGDGTYIITSEINSDGGQQIIITEVVAIPEPSTATLSLLALAGLLARRRRKQA